MKSSGRKIALARKNQAQTQLIFFLFFGFGGFFVSLRFRLSRTASNLTSTWLIWPRRSIAIAGTTVRWRLSEFWGAEAPTKMCLSCPLPIENHLRVHPKRSPAYSRIFVTGGAFFARHKWPILLFSWRSDIVRTCIWQMHYEYAYDIVRLLHHSGNSMIHRTAWALMHLLERLAMV